MAARRHPLRDRVLSRVQRGEIASIAEIMLVASIPRQTANRWLREAGIDLATARLRSITRMREHEERYLAGLPPTKKPSKAYLRRIADKAVRDFNRAQQKRMAEAASRDPGE